MQSNSEQRATAFYPVFALIVIAGAGLRLFQFTDQVLLDDEWHVVHQLLRKSPSELFLTFGHADFSIPLAMLYWFESRLFGLSEFAMRWPMMLAGIATLLVFPLYVRKFFSDRVTLLFAALLAITPLMIIYSRTARPYALTLLLSWMAIGAFYRFVKTDQARWKPALLYMLCAISCAWLHLVSLPIVVAPFLVFGIPALLKKDWGSILRMFWLGIASLAGMLLLLLPPFLSHPEALSVKLGQHQPALHTVYGALFSWFGTSSAMIVFSALFLAALGARPLWRKFPLTPSILAGLALACVLILVIQPAWVQHPITFARYLLPVIPLWLLAVAAGLELLYTHLAERFRRIEGRWSFGVLSLAFLAAVVSASPLSRILAYPNSNSLHSVYQFDFREPHNLMIQYQADFPVSPFWKRMAAFPVNSFKMAAGPFSFETYHWDAARWEQISRQRVMPAYLEGFCAEGRWGEVPDGRGFRFRNVGYLSDIPGMIERGFDLVVYQKPFTVETRQGEIDFGLETAACVDKIRAQYPQPVYEDEGLLVIPLTQEARERFDAAR